MAGRQGASPSSSTPAIAAPQPLAARPLSQLTVDFLCDLADTRALPRSGRGRCSATPTPTTCPGRTRIKISTRLRTPARTDLRGASLQGEDLSYRDLQGVDLTGADLTDAQLVGTRPDAAPNCATPGWCGARLDEAQLTGADLTRRRPAPAPGWRAPTCAASRSQRQPLAPRGADRRARRDPSCHGARAARRGDRARPPGGRGAGARRGRRPVRLRGRPDARSPVAYSADGDDARDRQRRRRRAGLRHRAPAGRCARCRATAAGSTRWPTRPGDLLVTGAADGTVRLWDPATGECLRHVLAGHQRVGLAGRAEPGRLDVVATGDASGTCGSSGRRDRRDRATGWHRPPGLRSARRLPPGTRRDRPPATAVVRSGTRATGALRRAAARATTGRSTGSVQPGRRAARGRRPTGGIVRVWDTATGRAPARPHRPRRARLHPRLPPAGPPARHRRHRGRTCGVGPARGRAAPHPAQATPARSTGSRSARPVTLLATGDSDGRSGCWDTATGGLRHELTGHTGSVWPFVFRPDGAPARRPAATSGTTRLWDPATGAVPHTLSGHGRRISSSGSAPTARCSPPAATTAWSGSGSRRPAGARSERSRASPTGCRAAAFSPPGPAARHRRATTARLQMLDLDTGGLRARAQRRHRPRLGRGVRPGRRDILATAERRRQRALWYRTTGRQVRPGRTPRPGTVDRVQPRRRDAGHRLRRPRRAVVGRGVGRCLRTLEGHTDRVYALVVPDGALLASAQQRRHRAGLGPRHRARCTHVLTRHTGRLWATAFDPYGGLLATAGDDLVIRLWDPRVRRPPADAHRAHPPRLVARVQPEGAPARQRQRRRHASLWTVASGQATART